MSVLLVVDRPGQEDYGEILSLQERLLAKKAEDRSAEDLLILTEHAAVYTAGRGTAFENLLDSAKAQVKWFEISRGGGVTFHGPGQLVAYPIFDLERHGKDVHVFLRKLEAASITCLLSFGVQARTRPGLTGVWVDISADPHSPRWKKIVSIGVGVRRWISWHGLAMNVSTDLDYFRAVHPCGQDGQVMTSMESLLSYKPSMADVKSVLAESIKQEFAFSKLEVAEGAFTGASSASASPAIAKVLRPKWLKARVPASPVFEETKQIVKDLNLVTVCEEARCPNMGECWSHRTATFMIMGEQCTRRCGFCAVKDGTVKTLSPLNPLEPLRVAQAVSKLGLKHVVITSVNRDDLPDMGAWHFHRTVSAISRINPECDIELLIPDMRGQRNLVSVILLSGKVKVLNHNIETVPRLYKKVRPGSSFERSLSVLSYAKEVGPEARTKSGLMVGLGETREEVLEVMDRLREVDVNVLTIGQYMQPTAAQLPIQRYVTPEEFALYETEGLKRGFLHVESSPLVRSSYHAWKHTGEANKEKTAGLKEAILITNENLRIFS